MAAPVPATTAVATAQAAAAGGSDDGGGACQNALALAIYANEANEKDAAASRLSDESATSLSLCVCVHVSVCDVCTLCVFASLLLLIISA